MHLAPVSSVEILPCPVALRAEALAVFYRRVPDSVRTHLVAEARNEAAAGRLDLSGFWIGRRRGKIVGVILTQRLARTAAAVWAPEVTTIWRRGALAAALVRAALEGLRQSGVKVAQAMIECEPDQRAAADLVRGGLRRITELIYLNRDTAPPLTVAAAAPRLVWTTFGPSCEDRFRAALQATYAESLDMPELDGTRTFDDILAAHRATGTFDPAHWWLGWLPAEPAAAAVLLMIAPPERPAWQIAYLGLTPPARGRGLGRATLAHALSLARRSVSRLDLAVDARNLPALRLYRAAGFTPFDQRAVYLARL